MEISKFGRSKQPELLPASTLAEIRKGTASPTLQTAIDNGGEVLDALRTQIATMNRDERAKLSDGLDKIDAALSGNYNRLNVLNDVWYKTFTPILCIILGWTAERSTGIPYLTTGGIVTAFALRSHLTKLATRQQRDVQERLERCRLLLSEAGPLD